MIESPERAHLGEGSRLAADLLFEDHTALRQLKGLHDGRTEHSVHVLVGVGELRSVVVSVHENDVALGLEDIPGVILNAGTVALLEAPNITLLNLYFALEEPQVLILIEHVLAIGHEQGVVCEVLVEELARDHALSQRLVEWGEEDGIVDESSAVVVPVEVGDGEEDGLVSPTRPVNTPAAVQGDCFQVYTRDPHTQVQHAVE